MRTKHDYLEKDPSGQYYMIHPSEEDGICLHALSILQADLIGCFLPLTSNADFSLLTISLQGCIPISELNGKDRIYVRHNCTKLISDFLFSLIQSQNRALSPGGILFSKEHLYYDAKNKKLVCIYLPLNHLILSCSPSLSSLSESDIDELLGFFIENKWLAEKAMDPLYEYIRNSDESLALSYLKNDFLKESRAVPRDLEYMILLWVFTSVLFLLFSKEEFLSRSLLFPPLSKFLFLTSTVSLVFPLYTYSRSQKKSGKKLSSEKEKRRKTRNVHMLFPDDDSEFERALEDYTAQPVQFIEVGVKRHADAPYRFTVWTHPFVVGLDSDFCDLSLEYAALSLKHALFGKDETGIYVEDLFSKKGTFLNRRRLMEHERGYIHEGDIIGLGDLEFEARFIYD